MRRFVGALVVLTGMLTGCGSAASGQHHPRSTPPLASYDAAHARQIIAVAVDATHVYWATGPDEPAIWRRAHGPRATPERWIVLDDAPAYLAVGDSDVLVVVADGRLRALPKAGGAPTELAAPTGAVWALAAAGDAAWLGVDDRLERWSRESDRRTVALPEVGSALALDGDTAFVLDATPALRRVDLASGAVATLSTDEALAQATTVAVSGETVLVALADRIAGVPRDGGALTTVRTGAGLDVVADATGYVAAGPVVVAQAHGEPARVLATSTFERDYSAFPLDGLVVAGPYVYTVAYDVLAEAYVLHAAVRGQGATVLRGRPGAPIDVASAGGRVFAVYGDAGAGTLVELGADRARVVDSSLGTVFDILTTDDAVVPIDEQGGLVVDLATGKARRIDVPGRPLAIHRDVLYWAQGSDIWGTRLGGGKPFFLADPLRADPGLDPALTVAAAAFAEDAMFIVSASDAPGVIRIDERGGATMHWRYDRDGFLGLDIVALDGALFVHDDERVYRLADGAVDVVFTDRARKREIVSLARAGDRVVAVAMGDAGTAVIAIPTGAGRARVLHESAAPISPEIFTTGDRAVFVYVAALDAVIRIDVP
jgi:hypothetical protein